MTSTGQEFMNQFTVSNQGIKEIRELLFLSILQYGSITETLTLETGVVNGSRLGGIGEMEAVGKPSNGCDPQWNATRIATQEKMWELFAYEVAESICYADLEATMVQFSLRTGTNRADLTGTDYMDVIVEPLLSQALEKMIWRMMWFNNRMAEHFANGGTITDGINLDLIRVNDGLFKRIFDITGANPSQRIVINANNAGTYALQIEQINASGVATEIFRQILRQAPIRLRQKSDKILLVTQSLADALTDDLKRNNGSDLQWKAVLDGMGNERTLMTTTKYNGQKIIALPIWDEMIETYQDNGTALHRPHRAVFAPKSTLLGGVEGTDQIADLQIWFEQIKQRNYMLCKDKVGTLTWEDDLIMAAY